MKFGKLFSKRKLENQLNKLSSSDDMYLLFIKHFPSFKNRVWCDKQGKNFIFLDEVIRGSIDRGVAIKALNSFLEINIPQDLKDDLNFKSSWNILLKKLRCSKNPVELVNDE